MTVKLRDSQRQSRLDDQRFKVLEYLDKNRTLIFSADEKDDVARKQLRAVMLAGMRTETARQLFDQLRRSTPRGEKIWQLGTVVYQWIKAGEGDCGGRDVLPYTQGLTPKNERCDAGFEGRVAVCWDGKTHQNAGSGNAEWCTYKLITPNACIGGSSRGLMYQCTSSFAAE